MKNKQHPMKTFLWLTGKLFPRLTDFVDEIVFFVQRGVRGWSDRDCWSIDYCLDEKIPAMLLRLKETKHGVPQDFVNQAVLERGGSLGRYEYGVDYMDQDVERGAELYNAMLDQIIDGFKAHREIDENDWDWTDIETCREKTKECRKRFEKGMYLFVKYYDTFWD